MRALFCAFILPIWQCGIVFVIPCMAELKSKRINYPKYNVEEDFCNLGREYVVA